MFTSSTLKRSRAGSVINERGQTDQEHIDLHDPDRGPGTPDFTIDRFGNKKENKVVGKSSLRNVTDNEDYQANDGEDEKKKGKYHQMEI